MTADANLVCRRCGYTNVPGDTFCGSCGAFLEWANAAGCARACDGLGMLVETAAASFHCWHGVQPDTDTALDTLRRTLL